MPTCIFPTALGNCRITWSDAGVSRFQLPPNSPAPGDVSPPSQIVEAIALCQKHLSGAPQDFSEIKIDWEIFQEFPRRVYEQTVRIPAGSTATYGQISRALDLPIGASRAVGATLGANPIPLLIPCHRVVAASGKMTGFSSPGGIPVKIKLLSLERAELALE